MENKAELSFGARVGAAFACFFRALSDSDFAGKAKALMEPSQPAPTPKPAPAPKPVELPPERLHASAQELMQMDRDLTKVIDSWPILPAALKAGILATVEAARAMIETQER